MTSTSTTVAPTFEKIEDVAYNDTETLDIYVPAGDGAWPVLVMLHGGLGNPGRYAPTAEALAAEGVLVMNVTWQSNEPTQQSAEGVACALRFARATAGDYGGDAENVVVMGHSAGAAIGSITALSGDSWGGEGCSAAEVSALPNAFIGVAGPYDPTATPGDDRSFIKTTDPELYERLNPLNHLGNNPDLVVLLLHGDRDSTVPIESSIQFHEALLGAGYQTSLMILEGIGHEDPVAPAADVFATTIGAALSTANR